MVFRHEGIINVSSPFNDSVISVVYPSEDGFISNLIQFL